MLFTDHREPEIASPLPEMSILETLIDELIFFHYFLFVYPYLGNTDGKKYKYKSLKTTKMKKLTEINRKYLIKL